MSASHRSRRPKTDAVATCACGERIAAPNLDRLNVLLGRHYKVCQLRGDAEPRVVGQAPRKR